MTDFLHVSGHEILPLASTLLGHLFDWDIGVFDVEIMTSTSCVHSCACACVCVCVSGETSLSGTWNHGGEC